MHLFDVVLFFHLAIAIAAFAIAGILHTAQYVTRSAKTVGDVRSWVHAASRLEPLFPILALALFGFGAWLVHLSGGEFRWSDGWVITASLTLLVMEARGGGILAPKGKHLHKVTDETADGPIDVMLRAALMDRAQWITSHFVTAIALGVVFLMATKPNGWQSPLIVAIAGLLGATIGAAGVGALASSRPPAPAPAAEAATP